MNPHVETVSEELDGGTGGHGKGGASIGVVIGGSATLDATDTELLNSGAGAGGDGSSQLKGREQSRFDVF